MAKERLKKVVEKMVVNIKKKGGVKKKESISSVARDCDYSEAYILSGKLQKTQSFHELFNEKIPPAKLVKVHTELLGAAAIQHYVFPRDKKKVKLNDAQIKAIIESVEGCKLIYIKQDHFLGQVAFYQAPDAKSRREALDMAYKVSGNYSPDKIEITKRKYQDLTDEELEEEIKKYKDFYKKK